MKLFLPFLAASLAASARAARRQVPQPRPRRRRLSFDDRDGRLSADEFIKAEAIHDRQQAGNFVSDSVVTARVKAALLRERGIKSTGVHVESSQGRVLLSGFVDTEEQKQRVLRVASRIEGVREVRDGLNVR